MLQVPPDGTQLICGKVALFGPTPVNRTVPSLTGWVRVAVKVSDWLRIAGFGVAVRLMAIVPLPTTTWRPAWAPDGYCVSPDHVAVIDQVPAAVGVQEMWQLPEEGKQVCCVNVEPVGPVPVNVIVPSLAGTDSVAVRTVAWPLCGADGFAVSVIDAVAGLTVRVVVPVAGPYAPAPDQVAVMLHVPGADACQVTWHVPPAGVQVCVGNTALPGPDPENVTVPPLVVVPSVAVRVTGWPVVAGEGDAVNVSVVLRPLTVTVAVFVAAL